MTQPSRHRHDVTIVPTIGLQSWGFMIGSALFALGSAPYLSDRLGTTGANVSFFVGSWFFTTAAIVQLALSGPATVASAADRVTNVLAIRAIWLSSAVQLLGTILFNVSTGAALTVRTVEGEQRLVWGPNADGSAAFLISASIALIPLLRRRVWWAPRTPDWSSTWMNLLGAIAFGVSAVAAIVSPDGNVHDASVARISTFIGAVCFFIAAAIVLAAQPSRSHRDAT